MMSHANGTPSAGGASAPWWRTGSAVVLWGFLLVAGFYLLTEHTAHVFGALPYLLLLSCPLMHLFMHHGHGGHQHGGSDPTSGSERRHDT